jgi:hypothetical protein
VNDTSYINSNIHLNILFVIKVNYGRGTERRKDMEGGEEVGSGQKSLEKLRGSPLLLHRRQQEMKMMICNYYSCCNYYS